MQENNKQSVDKSNKKNKVLTKRDILKKINFIDHRIKKNERELKQVHIQWKKKKDSIEILKKDFETHLQLLHTAPEVSNIIADKKS